MRRSPPPSFPRQPWHPAASPALSPGSQGTLPGTRLIRCQLCSLGIHGLSIRRPPGSFSTDGKRLFLKMQVDAGETEAAGFQALFGS